MKQQVGGKRKALLRLGSSAACSVRHFQRWDLRKRRKVPERDKRQARRGTSRS